MPVEVLKQVTQCLQLLLMRILFSTDGSLRGTESTCIMQRHVQYS